MLRKSGQAVARVREDMGSLHFKWIIPYESVLSLEILGNPNTWMMLLFGFAPLLFNNALANSLEHQLVFLVAYFALAWAAYFYVFVAKRTTNLWLGLATAVFTIVIGVPFGRLLKHTLLSVFYGMTTSPSDVMRLLGQVFSNGLNEELLKVLPLLFLAFGMRQIRKPLDGVFYGALSGLGFAAWEGYRFITQAQGTGGILVQTVLLRSTTLPFLHATFTAISGYFIALASVSHRRIALCMAGVAVASILHGCYDFASNTIEVAIAAFTYLLLTCYVNRSQQTVQELMKAEAVQPASQ